MSSERSSLARTRPAGSLLAGARSRRPWLAWALSRRRSATITKVLAYIILFPGAVMAATPFVWLVSTSLKEPYQVYRFPPEWIPDPVRWQNYVTAWTLHNLPLVTYNTAVITLVSMLGMIASATLVAYTFARVEAPGRNVLFMLLLATMMLPEQVTMIPTFILFRYLGWVNTFKPLIVPAFLGGGAFNIFLLRQFYMTLPRELDDAARIDGCGTFGIYWRILLPLLKPAVASISVFHFIWHWNDFLGPLIYLSSRSKWVLALAIKSMQGEFFTDMGPMMAMSFVSLLPCILVFFFAQRYFVTGIVMTGIIR